MVLVDTNVWSLVLRRRVDRLSPGEQTVVAEWSDLVRKGAVRIIGPIRQEILSGVRDQRQFASLERYLSDFPDARIIPTDYVEAARFFNGCRTRGVTGTPTDLLICAVARRFRWAVFSLDPDFNQYAQLLPIQLYEPR